MSISVILLCITLFTNPSYGNEPILLKAMEDELGRSLELKLDHEAGPYYISYLVRDCCTCIISAGSGAITKNEVNRRRYLDTTVKVGDYGFDNSHFSAMESSRSSGLPGILTLDDNNDVLRRQIWIETDGAYKSAVAALTEKKAYFENKICTDSLADFIKGEAFVNEEPIVPLTMEKRNELAMLVGNVAKLFLKNERILKSEILLKMNDENIYYVNSEGVRCIKPHREGRLVITASTKADDGMPLKNFLIYTFADPNEVPEGGRLARDVEGMIQELMALRSAPVIDDYSGPVIFEKQASAEMLTRGFVRLLAAKRSSQSNVSLFDKSARKLENPFLKKVGGKVIGQSISIKARPGQSTYKGIPLLGSYGVDDEGTKAQETNLVEGGFLKQFMLSRSPLQGFTSSNGHFRGSTTAPSVIEISSTKALGYEVLKKKLISTVRDEGLKYGYIIKSILPPELSNDEDGSFASLFISRSSSGASEFELSKPVMIFRVSADRKEELVRGAELGKMNISIFKSISGIADDPYVYNYTVNFSGLRNDSGTSESAGYQGDTYATIVTPSIMVPEVELSRSSDCYQKPPIVSNPLHER